MEKNTNTYHTKNQKQSKEMEMVELFVLLSIISKKLAKNILLEEEKKKGE